MISIQKRFLFIHVPKTGGNSIQDTLRNYSEDDIVATEEYQDGIERFNVTNRQYDISKHSTLSNYKSVIGTDTYQSLFKFAAIRNPWDMMISHYFSPHRGAIEWDRNDFLALIRSVPTLRYYICERSFPEEILLKVGIKKRPGPRPLDGDVDFLMRFEHLDEDFQAVCCKLDIPFTPLPKRNASIHLHYSKYYDAKLREIVGKKFAEEIKFGNYSFENG